MSSTDNGIATGTWRAGLQVYLHPRVLAMLFLGFVAGLPFLLVASTLSAWLQIAGVGIEVIGLFALFGLAYSLKFLWAPIIDRASIPILTGLLGRRRSWMLLSQVVIGLSLLGYSLTDPGSDLRPLALLTFLTAFAAATQDIVIDAYRIEAVELKVQGAMAASYQFGYRLGLVAAGAGALIVAQAVSFQMAYVLMAALMLVGVITVLIIAEPEVYQAQDSIQSAGLLQRLSRWFADAFVGPFVEFFRRNGRFALVLLLFIGCYRITDMVLGTLANPFYLETGFTLVEIGTVTKVFGLFVTMFGAGLGGVAVVRYGLSGPLVFGAFILAVTNLTFAGMALIGPQLWYLFVTIGADNLAAGFTGTVFIAYLSGLTNVRYTATQYALFSSLMTLPGKLLSAGSGFIVAQFDWFMFFVYAALMGIPGILLAILVVKRMPNE